MNSCAKIYFLCPVNRKPSGGVKQLYRMVDILNRNGYDASVVHKKKHRENWFNNNTQIQVNPYLFKKIKYASSNKKNLFQQLVLSVLKAFSFQLNPEDIIVVPEIFGPRFHETFSNRFVIFNQNCYYTFDGYQESDPTPYFSEKHLATLVVSEDSLKYLQTVFPEINVHRIRLGIDKSIFKVSGTKKKQISYMPRKLSEEVSQVLQILKFKDGLKDWIFAAIDGKSEAEVATILQQSTLFLSFNHREGFGLPPAEAMACGCYVIGYTGQGGKEYFKPEFSAAVEAGNILKFVKEIEVAAESYSAAPEKITEKGKWAESFVTENYSFQKEEESILEAWKKMLG